MKKLISLFVCISLLCLSCAALADGKVTPPAETAVTTIAQAVEDVNGDGVADTVTLTGKQVPDAALWENLSLTVKDGATGETAELALYESTGYDPQLWTGSLTAPESREIMVTLESGGSGGTCYYSVFGAKDGGYAPIFDTEAYCAENIFSVTFEDQYLVRVQSAADGTVCVLSLANREADYLNELYNEDGTLKSAATGDVYGLGYMLPVDTDGDGVCELVAFQSVCGLYHADALGTLMNVLHWDGERFVSNGQSVIVPMEAPAAASEAEAAAEAEAPTETPAAETEAPAEAPSAEPEQNGAVG